MLNFGHQRTRKKWNGKYGCSFFLNAFVLMSNSVVFVRVPPALTGQRAIWPPKPLSQRGQDACRSLTRNENDRHVTLRNTEQIGRKREAHAKEADGRFGTVPALVV